VAIGDARGRYRLIEDDDLRFLSGMTHLALLDLENTAVTDAGMAHLRGLTGLRTLLLSGTAVSDRGLAHVGTLEGLEVLSLAGTRVGNAGLERLGSLSRLESLDLRRTDVTDAGIVRLGGLEGLRRLDTRGTRVSPEGRAALGRPDDDEGPGALGAMPSVQVLAPRIDLRPLHDPYLLGPGDRFDVRVTFDGRPLVGRRVGAFRPGDGEPVRRWTTTDGNGVARFTLDRGGFWLVRVVHLRACTDCAGADWESFWASLTFEVATAREGAEGSRP
jgi:hypothetical protein